MHAYESKNNIVLFFAIWICLIALLVFWMISRTWVGMDQRTLRAEMQAQEIAAINSIQQTHAGDVPAMRTDLITRIE